MGHDVAQGQHGPGQRFQQASPLLLWPQGHVRWQIGQPLGQFGLHPAHLPQPNPLHQLRQLAGSQRRERPVQRLAQHTVGRQFGQSPAPTPAHLSPAPLRVTGYLLHKARLAHPRFTLDQHQPSLPADGCLQVGQ